jgi:ABC-2 type transport system permease protein
MSAEAQPAGGPVVPAATGNGPDVVPNGAVHSGVIHNIGYRRYDGLRLGRGAIVRALTWNSLRAAFGFGRGAKAKIFPVLLFALMVLPAIVNAIAVAENPGDGAVVSYDVYQPQLRTVAMLIFVAIAAPNLISADLRYHSLPLYFARPIRRSDYPLAKLLAFVLACLAMIEIPLLVLWIGNVAVAHGPGKVWAQTTQLGPGLLYGAAWAILLASLGLLLASATGKRVFAICAIGIPLFFSWILATVLMNVGSQSFGPAINHQPSALASLAGLISPFTLLGGLLHWLQKPVPLIGPGHGALGLVVIGPYGPVYAAVFAVLVIAAIGGLFARYRKVGVA